MFEPLHELWYRLRSRLHRDSLDIELAEELRAHAAFLEEEARANGASPEEIKRMIGTRLGNQTNIRERTRERWSLGWIEALLQDTRYAFRFLRRSPGFTAVAVLSMALGIGANATVFSVTDKLLFSAPEHVADADNLLLVNVKRASEPGGDAPFQIGATFAEYLALTADAESFAAVAVNTTPEPERLGHGPEAPRIKESIVSTNFFDVVGARPFKGRFFLTSDDSLSGSDRAAVISHGHWQKHYGGTDSALGSRFQLSGLDFVVVGIAPKGFTGVEIDAADVWVPLAVTAPVRIQPEWQKWVGATTHVTVRLRDGISPTTAAAEATTILRRLPERRRAVIEETVELGPIVAARGPSQQTDAVKISTKLMMASALVLLATCANLANLLLVRALTRRREIALRLAIGVSRMRLATQLLLEALIISFAGAFAALFVARWSGDTLRKLVFPDVQWGVGAVDVRVFVFAVLCGTGVATIASVLPAFRLTRDDVASALRSAASQLTASTGRIRQGLLVVQVAMSVLMIVGASAFSSSLKEAYRFDLGFDADRIISARVFPKADSITATARLEMLEEGARRVRSIVGVERVTVSGNLPLRGNRTAALRIPEQPGTAVPGWRWQMTPDLLGTVGVHLVRGRFFTEADVSAAFNGPVLMTQATAQKLWPGVDPIGRCVRLGADTTPCLTVVGIIADFRNFSLRDKAQMGVVVGEAQPTLGVLDSYIVTRVKPGANLERIEAEMRARLRDVRPDISSLEVRPLTDALERDYRPLRIGTITIGSFAVLAIILAAIGLYGILAFSVAQRTNEFGIRSALGARAGHIVRSVVGEAMVVVVLGIGVGVALSWYASTAIASLLFQTNARDVVTFIYAAIVLGIVAIAASLVPAWRATRVDPAIALRAE